MQGRARTQAGQDLATIFFHIRTTRERNQRQNWQRRARQALAQIEWLTPAERHEIAAVWSRPDADRIDSPAMRKLFGDRAPRSDWQTIPASAVMRQHFDATGQRRAAPKKKPGLARLDFGDAANDQSFSIAPDARRARPNAAASQPHHFTGAYAHERPRLTIASVSSAPADAIVHTGANSHTTKPICACVESQNASSTDASHETTHHTAQSNLVIAPPLRAI